MSSPSVCATPTTKVGCTRPPTAERALSLFLLAPARPRNTAVPERLSLFKRPSPAAGSATPCHRSRSPMGGFGSPVQAVGVLGWTGADQHGLDAAAIQRYSRHLALPQFGPAAQGAHPRGSSAALRFSPLCVPPGATPPPRAARQPQAPGAAAPAGRRMRTSLTPRAPFAPPFPPSQAPC